MTDENPVDHLLERSAATVRNGHAWTQADHDYLVSVVSVLTRLAQQGATANPLPQRPSPRALYALRRRQ